MSERDSEILARRASGDELELIARDYGLTREAIRLIVKKHGGASASEVREVRRERNAGERRTLVADFVRDLGPAIQAAAASGVTRSDTHLAVQLLCPDLPGPVISDGIDAVDAVFNVAVIDIHYSERVIAAAAWYVAGMLAQITGSAAEALPSIEIEQAKEINEALSELGLTPPVIASVIQTIGVARARCRSGETLQLTKADYEQCRIRFLATHGLKSAKGTVVWPPTSTTIAARFGQGYWKNAVQALGLKAGAGGRDPGLLTFTNEDYAQAVCDFEADAVQRGARATFAGYDAWSVEEDRAGRRRPSGPSIRREFKNWTNARRAAALRGTGQPRPTGLISLGRPVVSRGALIAAETALEERLDGLRTGDRRDAAGGARDFIRSSHEEFEIRHRDWLRSVVQLDPSMFTARMAAPRGLMSGKQMAISPEVANVDAVLTDRYLDSLLKDGDPTETDRWLRADLQREIDALSSHHRLAFAAGRALRNLFTHHSGEAEARVVTALANLAAEDDLFELRQAPTTRVLGDWLISSDARRMVALVDAIPAFWRLAVVVETLAPPTT